MVIYYINIKGKPEPIIWEQEEVTMKVKVVLNEQHRLMDDQRKILNEMFESNWEIYPVPENGWKLSEMAVIADELEEGLTIFASPIPALMSILNAKKATFSAFHNDNREKKELPNGHIIMAVASDGWRIV